MIFLADNIEFILNAEDSFIDLLGCVPAEEFGQLGNKDISHTPEFIHFYFMVLDSTDSTEKRLMNKGRAELW